jgi:hypothetical protein
MNGTRMIFHLSDEDEVTDSAVAVLDVDSPETYSESDTLELGALLPGPSASIPDAQSEVDLTERPEMPLGDLDSARQRLPPKRPPAHHRCLAYSRMRSGRPAEPHRPRRAFAFGAFGALVVIMVMIVAHPGRSEVAPQTPTSTQGATLARSDPIASPPDRGEATSTVSRPWWRPASTRPWDRRRLAAFPAARHRRTAPVTLSNKPTVVEQQVRPTVSVSEASTATPTPSPTSTPEPAHEVPPSKPATATNQSPSDGYAEFSFER